MAYKNLTYEEYKQEIYNICKEKYAVVKAYPQEFEKEFEREDKKGDLKWYYDKGYTPADVAGGIALMV